MRDVSQSALSLSRRQALEMFLLAGGAGALPWSRGLASPVYSKFNASDLNILIYGDAGSGEEGQYAAGEAMAREHLISPFDFAVSVGDNQYIATSSDTYERIFERPYARLIESGVPFFQTLGNHDWEWGRATDQLEYASKVDAIARGKGGFVLPAKNYVIKKPGVKLIFASTTNAFGLVDLSKETFAFLDRELSEEFFGWKILITHLPFFSTGPRGDNRELQSKLFPLLRKYPVDLYFAGHEHNAELMKPWEWMTHAVVGNGREYRPGRVSSEQRSLFFMDQVGFARLRISGNEAMLQFINSRNQILYSTDIQRKPGVWGDIVEQQGDRVKMRLRLLGPDSIDDVQAQFGFSNSYSSASSPIFRPSDWTFSPVEYEGVESSSGLQRFSKTLVREDIDRWAVARFQVPSEPGRWIYADLGRPVGNGSYDGVSNFLKIEKF